MGEVLRIPKLVIPAGVPVIGGPQMPRCNHMGWVCPTVLIPTRVAGGKTPGFWGKIKDFFIKPMVTVYLTQNAACLNPQCQAVFTFGPPAPGTQAAPPPEAGPQPAAAPHHN